MIKTNPKRVTLTALTLSALTVLIAVHTQTVQAAGAVAAPAAPASATTNPTLQPDAHGMNPHPVHLLRPPEAPLSALARLGEQLFHDTSLSASGKQSCASCHNPDNAYAPANNLTLQLGGPKMNLVGHRPPPSLTYLYRQSGFFVGPDSSDEDMAPTLDQAASQAQAAAAAAGIPHPEKTVGATTSATALVPQGGLFWDGRADSLQDQAYGPLLNPVEMANPSTDVVAEKLRHSSYIKLMGQLFGPGALTSNNLLVNEAMSAISRYQIESPSFHPFTSKYDYWLEGRVAMTPQEVRGYKLFNNADKANCAGCHLSQPTKTGLPPLFTDTQYEALGAPRNMAIPANHNPKFYDIGICGPDRTDMKDQKPYCSMFLTPTLRNATTRKVFFHNGVFHTLQEVMNFYDFRDTDPGKVYPRGPNGKPVKYNDIPRQYLANVDVTDPPFDRKLGQKPAMTEQDMRDIIAFMGTLKDGYKLAPVTQASR